MSETRDTTIYDVWIAETEGRYTATKRVEPAVYEQIIGHSMRMAQEIYRTTNDTDLQGILEVKPEKKPQPVSKDVVSTLIGKLGLSLEDFDEVDGVISDTLFVTYSH